MPISSLLGSSALIPAGLGFRNKIINGDMRVNQRSAASYTGAAGQIYTLDRYWFYASSGTVNVSQSTSVVPTGFGTSLAVTVVSGGNYSSGGNYCLLGQHIEAANCQDFDWGSSSGKPMMVSFWVRSSVTGLYTFSIQNYGYQNSVYVASYNINAANTWEYKTVQIPAPPAGTTWNKTGTTGGVLLGFALGTDTNFQTAAANVWGSANAYGIAAATDVAATTGATWYLTGLQIEQNVQPTPFEQRPIGVELALCQRYYFRYVGQSGGYNRIPSTGGSYSNSAWQGVVSFPTPMRATPTSIEGLGIGCTDNISFDSTAFSSVTLSATNSHANAAFLQCTGGSGITNGIGQILILRGGATAYLALSAEL